MIGGDERSDSHPFLVESERALEIRRPPFRRALLAFLVAGVFLWSLLVISVFLANLNEVSTFNAYAESILQERTEWLAMVVGGSLFAVAVTIWGTASIRFDLKARLVRSASFWPSAGIPLDPSVRLVLQRHAFSFRRHLLLLRTSDGRHSTLFVGPRDEARAIADAVVRATRPALEGELALEERLGEIMDQRGARWTSWGTVAVGVLMIGLSASLFVRHHDDWSDPFAPIARFRSVVILLNFASGAYLIHVGRMLALPPERRHERYLSAVTLWLLASALLSYAVTGVVDGVRDAITVIDDPGFATVSAATDLFFPTAAAAAAWTGFRHAWERYKTYGPFGS